MPAQFQNKVYNILSQIPKGKVTTYKMIADKLNSKAYRAVGSACNKNPYAPNIPCHRVVNSDGRVGGFARGKKAKILLLKKEGVFVKKDKIVDFEKKLFH